MNKLYFTIFLILILTIPTSQGAFNLYDTLEFGSKFSIIGNATVTTNATTDIRFNSTTFNG